MIWRFVKGLLKIVVALVVVLVVSGAIAFGSIEYFCAPPATSTAETPSLPIDDANYRRLEANTYFTFPEWYIVYSFEDFGRFLETKPESEFPYFSQIAGFWRSYCGANRLGAGLPGDHLEYKRMVYVIGVSFTYELAIKGLYENTIGRLTEWFRGSTPSAEDVYARRVTQEYGTFLHEVPWYGFPFTEKLSGLWRETPLVGGNPVRSIERKVALSAEYLVKAGYASLLTLTIAAAGLSDDPEIRFVVKGDPAPILAAEPTVHLVRPLPDGMSLLIAPRYAAFTDLVKRLAPLNVEYVELAGNRRIMLTAIVPEGVKPAVSGTREVFSLPVDATPGMVRIGVDLDVADLSPIVNAYKAAGIEVEHVYDY